MFCAFAISVTLTTLCGAVPHVGFNTVVGDQNEERSADVFGSKPSAMDRFFTYGLTEDIWDATFPEYSTKTRKKRMVPIISKASLALAKLLSRSKGVAPYSTLKKNYMKKGSFGNAILDFETFGPKYIKYKKTSAGVRVVEGRTEGFKFKISSPGYKRDADAILEITEFRTKKGDPDRTYNIMYMKKDQLY